MLSGATGIKSSHCLLSAVSFTQSVGSRRCKLTEDIFSSYNCSIPSLSCILNNVMVEVMSRKIEPSGLRRRARQWTGDWELDSLPAQPKPSQKIPAGQSMSKQSKPTPTPSQSPLPKAQIPFPSLSETIANAAPDIAPQVTVFDTPTQQISMAAVSTAATQTATARLRKTLDGSDRTDEIVAMVAGSLIFCCILFGGLWLYVRRLRKHARNPGTYEMHGEDVKDLEEGDTLALAELASPIAVVAELPASSPSEVRSVWSLCSSKQQISAIDT
jgi:hypothetical protein